MHDTCQNAIPFLEFVIMVTVPFIWGAGFGYITAKKQYQRKKVRV